MSAGGEQTANGRQTAGGKQTASGRQTASGEQASIEVEPARLASWLAHQPQPEVIDVRERYEREAGHIEGTRHIALTELSAAAQTVATDRPVVFYCRVGSRSRMAAEAFRAAGFDAYTMSGGLLRWVAEGLPLAPPNGHVADH